MADERTFAESELTAIVADRVQRETAELTAATQTLTTEKAELENKLDVAEAARVAAESAKAEAERELADLKQQIEDDKVKAERQETRIKAAREAASHLAPEFFDDEDRVKRIVAMDDDAFQGYVADLKATATGAPKSKEEAPRQTAMEGQPAGGEPTNGAAKDFILRKYEPAGA